MSSPRVGCGKSERYRVRREEGLWIYVRKCTVRWRGSNWICGRGERVRECLGDVRIGRFVRFQFWKQQT